MSTKQKDHKICIPATSAPQNALGTADSQSPVSTIGELRAVLTCLVTTTEVKGKKGKAIPVIGREGPQGCEKSSLPYFL
jgi:hypothetical protein